MRKKILNWIPLLFLIIFSFSTRFYNLDYPSKVIFDEAHFGLYAIKYLSHQYYFDIHPPLGKLLFGLVAFLSKAKPGFDFSCSSDYQDFNFLPLRALTALFGSLFVILIYFLVRELGFSQKAAFLAAFFVLFDNAFLIQSRLILLDIILIFFIFLSLYLFLLAKKTKAFSQKWYLLNFLLGLSLGAAISIKWTGFGILAIIWFWDIAEGNFFSRGKKEILTKAIFTFFLPLCLYFLFFVIHFHLLPFPCLSNCGQVLDWWLEENKTTWVRRGLLKEEVDISFYNHPPPGNIFSKFFRVHKLMLASNLGFHSYYWESKWYSWPFMIRPVKYFSQTQGEKETSLFFLGNPLIWWLGTVGILGYLYLTIRNYFYRFKMGLPPNFYSPNCRLLFLSYLVYFLPFGAIERFMLIYHYLPALTFSIIFFAIFSTELLKKTGYLISNILFFLILILVLISFLYFLPFTYAFPLSQTAFKSRMWLSSWSL